METEERGIAWCCGQGCAFRVRWGISDAHYLGHLIEQLGLRRGSLSCSVDLLSIWTQPEVSLSVTVGGGTLALAEGTQVFCPEDLSMGWTCHFCDMTCIFREAHRSSRAKPHSSERLDSLPQICQLEERREITEGTILPNRSNPVCSQLCSYLRLLLSPLLVLSWEGEK